MVPSSIAGEGEQGVGTGLLFRPLPAGTWKRRVALREWRAWGLWRPWLPWMRKLGLRGGRGSGDGKVESKTGGLLNVKRLGVPANDAGLVH